VITQRLRNGIPFEELADADLIVDREYLGGSQGSMADDPIARLLPVGTLGGFRYRGSRQAPRLVVLYTSGAEADWPDELDLTTGTFTYYGDNRLPGKELHDSPRGGNIILRQTFELAHDGAEERRSVAPYFLFSKAGPGRDVVFRGVLAPGAAELTADEDLVAVWRNRQGKRFQNYRAKFTVLDIATAPRAWLTDVLAGDPLSDNCPAPWRRWVAGRHYEALISTRIEYRSPQDQQPRDQAGRQILDRVYSHFATRPTEFEQFAAHLWQMADGHVGTYEVTRATADGGRDAIGEYLIGPATDPVRVTFALEAKLYNPSGGGVGVKEVSRLISRLRHRQFGVLVTTGHVAIQAYREIRTDQHPIVILSGVDIVNLLRQKGYATPAEVTRWLNEAFPTKAITP
jgi:Restriction endonuclease AspBHI N-terminal/Restriction endonuclease